MNPHQRCLQAKVKYRNEPKQVMPKSEDISRSLEINAIWTFDTEFPTIFNKSCTYITFKSAVKHRQLGYGYPRGQTVYISNSIDVFILSNLSVLLIGRMSYIYITDFVFIFELVPRKSCHFNNLLTEAGVMHEAGYVDSIWST